MALKTFVKINSVTNLSDARYCAGMGVNQIGFCATAGQANYVDNQTIEEITGWISGIDVVCEVHAAKEVTTAVVEINSVSLVPEFSGKDIIFRTTLDELTSNIDKIQQIPQLQYVLLDGKGELSSEDSEQIKRLANGIPIVLGFGITEGNVNAILDEMPVKGIALTGSDEIRPGYKDYDELANILEAIEIDEY